MDALETCLPQHLGLRRGGLRRTVTTSIVVAATSLLIGPLIITIIIFHPLRGIIGNGRRSWCWADSSRSSREFGVDRLLIRCLLFFIGVIEDDDLAITRWPEESRLRSPKSFLANSASREVSAMKFSSSEDMERSITEAFLEELPCLKTGE
jgi:hypothetical protein